MKTTKPIRERRHFVRLVEYLPFKIGHEGYDIQAHALNISSSGVMCLIDRKIPAMTKVKVALTLAPPTGPGKAPHSLTLTGVVVRIEKDPKGRQFSAAIFFSDIKPKDQTLLSRYIEHRLRDDH